MLTVQIFSFVYLQFLITNCIYGWSILSIFFQLFLGKCQIAFRMKIPKFLLFIHYFHHDWGKNLYSAVKILFQYSEREKNVMWFDRVNRQFDEISSVGNSICTFANNVTHHTIYLFNLFHYKWKAKLTKMRLGFGAMLCCYVSWMGIQSTNK